MPKVTVINDFKAFGVNNLDDRKVMRQFPVMELEDALNKRYVEDTYIVNYHTEGGYRVNGGYPSELVHFGSIMLDVDTEPHEPWKEEALDKAIDRFCADESLQDWGVYFTRRGMRLFRPLAQTVSREDMRLVIADTYERLWHDHRLKADKNAKDAGRLFRVPYCMDHVPHWHRFTAAPLPVDLVALRARGAGVRPHGIDRLIDSRHVANDRLGTIAQIIQQRQRGTRHKISLALAGAFLTAGYSEPEVRRIFSTIFDGEREFVDSMKAVATTHEKVRAGLPVQGLGSLPRDSCRFVRQLLEADMYVEGGVHTVGTKEDAVAGMLAACRYPPSGVSIVLAGCGLGKTETARAVAQDRSEANLRTGFTFPTNALCEENMDMLIARNVSVQRLFAPQSMRDDAGEVVCKYEPAARAISASGLSVSLELCKGRTPALRCPHYETCPARDGKEGPDDASVIIAPHQLVRGVAEKVGTLFIDEPPEVLSELPFSAELIDELGRLSGYMDVSCRDAVDDVLAHLRSLPPIGVHKFEPPVSYDGSACRAALGNETTCAPRLLDTCIMRMREDSVFAARMGAVCKLWSVLCGQKYYGWPCIVRDRSIMYPFDALVEVVRVHPSVVLLDANGDMRKAAYEKIVGSDVPMSRFYAPDGAPIKRYVWPRRVNKTAWNEDKEAVIGTFNELMGALRGGGYGAGRVGVVTMKCIEDELRKEGDGYLWLHYGNEKGSDVMKECDVLVTFGDYFENIGSLEFWCDWLGLVTQVERRNYIMGVTKAHHEQACGRLRVIHRVKKGTMIHVGVVVPGGWNTYMQLHVNDDISKYFIESV